MSNNDSNLLFKDNGWWTCGCGGTAKVRVPTPANSKAIFMRSAQAMFGPVTGIEYQFQPHQNSIDVDAQDAKFWLDSGLARPQLAGYKGRMTRTGRTNGKDS